MWTSVWSLWLKKMVHLNYSLLFIRRDFLFYENKYLKIIIKNVQVYNLLHILRPNKVHLIIFIEIYGTFHHKIKFLLLFVIYSDRLSLLREQVFEAYNYKAYLWMLANIYCLFWQIIVIVPSYTIAIYVTERNS